MRVPQIFRAVLVQTLGVPVPKIYNLFAIFRRAILVGIIFLRKVLADVVSVNWHGRC